MRLKEFLQLGEAVKLDGAIKALRADLYKDKLGLGEIGRAAVEKILDTLLASTGDLQTFKRYYERFMREEPDAMDLVLDELFAKLGVKSAEEFFAKAFLKEAATPGDEDYDGDPAEVDTFWIVGWNDEESKAWVGEVTQRDSPKWVETASKGAPPSNWGGKRYMSYLSPDEVMSWLHRDYDEVEGPFFDEDEAIEHAEHKFGPLTEASSQPARLPKNKAGKAALDALTTMYSRMRDQQRQDAWAEWRGWKEFGDEYVMIDVRHWGTWEGDDGSGDYDWQKLSRPDAELLMRLEDQVNKMYKGKAEVSANTEEKNWIVIRAKSLGVKEAWNDSGAKDANGKWADYRDGKVGVEAMATWLYGSRVHKKTKAEKLKSAYGAIAQQENTSKLISKAKGDALRAALKKKYGSED